LKTAILIGLSIAEFEEITPYELILHLEAFQESQQYDMQERITLVWLGEYYHRLKRLPKIKDELKKLMPNEQGMTDEEMLEMVKSLNVQFGGTFEKTGGE
jgi:hypothetical protein